jgi:hypothetical protein
MEKRDFLKQDFMVCTCYTIIIIITTTTTTIIIIIGKTAVF